jgi:hypothetical protein
VLGCAGAHDRTGGVYIIEANLAGCWLVGHRDVGTWW